MTVRNRPLLATACLCLASLAGCASDGSFEVKNPFASEPPPPEPLKGSEAIDRDAYAKLGYGLVWSGFAAFDRAAETDQNLKRRAEAIGRLDKSAVLGDLLVISDSNSALSAINTTSGQLKWALQIGDKADRFTGLGRLTSMQGSGWVMAANETEIFLVNSETGQLADRQRLGRLAAGAPIIMGHLLTYASGDLVVGHALGTKGQAWAYRFPAAIKTDPVWTGGTTVCFVASDGTVGILDCDSGSILGSGKMFDNAGATPTVGDGAVFVASQDQSLWAFDVPTGRRRWQVRTDRPLTIKPDYAAGRVLLNVPGTGLIAVDSKTGNTAWKAPSLAGSVVAVRKGNIILWNAADSTASVIDPARGDVITSVKLENVARIVPSASADGDIYTISNRGEVSKFSPR